MGNDIGEIMNKDDGKIDLRDLDDAFNEREIKKLDDEAKGKNYFIVAVVLTLIYILASTVFYGIFAYRGGDPEIGSTGIFIDLLIIWFIVYLATDNDRGELRWLSVVFGTFLFMGGNLLIKNAFLYPLITHLLGMR